MRQGVNPQTPKSVIVNVNRSFLLGHAGLTHNHAPCCFLVGSRGIWGSPTPTKRRGQLVGQPRSQREGGSVWQIFTLERLKKSLLNIAKETAHPSVGRSLSAGHHRLILPLYRLRLNAPPQDRLHRSNVTMLARAKPNIPHREPLRTIHTVAISLVFPSKWLTITTCKAGVTLSNPPFAKPSWVVGKLPKTHRKRNSK